MKSTIALLMMVASCVAFAQSQSPSELDVFPKAEQGYQQLYIQLPATENDENHHIEVFIGKNEMVDCNYHTLLGECNEITLEGWGYHYYKVASNGNSITTLMACLDNVKQEKFIHLPPKIMPYNSKLPLVFYVPNGFKVKYKIYSGEAFIDATPVENTPQLGSIDYQLLSHFFVKNNAKLPVKNNRIDTQKKFDSLFGAASVMGKEGQATTVDFNREFIVPIILQETNKPTTIEIKGVAMGAMGTIIVHYKVTTGNPVSYTLRPFAAIRLDKKYRNKIILQQEP